MEQERTNNNQPVKKRALKIRIILVVAFVAYYTVMSLLSPAKMIRELRNNLAFSQDAEKKTDERIFSDSLYLALLKKKACFQSKLVMAKTDSVCLSVNLYDSTVNLEISGVVVHTAEISEMKISRLLKKGDQYIISSMLSQPFNIKKEISSIKKEPLMISIAPKDTSEFQPDILPDTTDSEPVNYIFEMHNDIRLYFYQDEEDEFSRFEFDLRERLRDTYYSLKSVIFLKIPEYKPYIRIHLPGTDAKIIYRALPRHGQVAVCM